jgi:hypothetical protein
MRVPRLFLRPQRAWTRGNRVDLLENGEQYYPAVSRRSRKPGTR